MKKSDIGLIGLAVMGENLVMNMESKGFKVSVFNRTVSKVTDFVEGRAKGLNIRHTYLKSWLPAREAPQSYADGRGSANDDSSKAPPTS